MSISLKAKKSDYCRHICKAWCCKNLLIHYDSNEKDIDMFFKLRGITKSEIPDMYAVPLKCKWLTNANKCKLYAWRPYTCKQYECDILKNMTVD